jgi:hypothetical protein
MSEVATSTQLAREFALGTGGRTAFLEVFGWPFSGSAMHSHGPIQGSRVGAKNSLTTLLFYMYKLSLVSISLNR